MIMHDVEYHHKCNIEIPWTYKEVAAVLFPSAFTATQAYDPASVYVVSVMVSVELRVVISSGLVDCWTTIRALSSPSLSPSRVQKMVGRGWPVATHTNRASLGLVTFISVGVATNTGGAEMNRPYHHVHGEIHPIIDLHLVSRLEMKPLNCLLHSSLMSVSD